METLPILDLFHGMQCQHRFCVECMATYIEGTRRAIKIPLARNHKKRSIQ
jgi:hypothetical protein